MTATTTGGTKNAAHLRREFDILLQATDGVGASSLIHALAVEAVQADTGKLGDTQGNPGYAWQPHVYAKKHPHDPVASRVAAAGASLGRILAGGHPTHRAYLAFLEAIYQVTMTQSDDVTERIGRLWDAQDMADYLPPVKPVRPGLMKRLWQAVRDWWRRAYGPWDEEL